MGILKKIGIGVGIFLLLIILVPVLIVVLVPEQESVSVPEQDPVSVPEQEPVSVPEQEPVSVPEQEPTPPYIRTDATSYGVNDRVRITAKMSDLVPLDALRTLDGSVKDGVEYHSISIFFDDERVGKVLCRSDFDALASSSPLAMIQLIDSGIEQCRIGSDGFTTSTSFWIDGKMLAGDYRASLYHDLEYAGEEMKERANFDFTILAP